MKQTKIFFGIIIAAAILSACILRIGGTSQLLDRASAHIHPPVRNS